jgi:quercetin dioxygenase-like cupin family protein
MTIARAFIPIIVFSAGLVVGTTLDASSPPAKSDVKTLMQMPLADEFTPGREVLVDLVQIPPNTTLDRHWHPGEEFHYYMEGEVEIKIDGEPSIIGTPGAVGHVPFKKWHMAVAGKKGAKILVFRVHTKGEPWRYVDKEGATER